MAIDIQIINKIIRTSLRGLGYFKIELKEQKKHSIFIEADGTLRSIYLEVFIEDSNKKHKLSSDEIKCLQEKAKSTNREAWSAILKVDKKGHVDNHIKWENLTELIPA